MKDRQHIIKFIETATKEQLKEYCSLIDKNLHNTPFVINLIKDIKKQHSKQIQ